MRRRPREGARLLKFDAPRGGRDNSSGEYLLTPLVDVLEMTQNEARRLQLQNLLNAKGGKGRSPGLRETPSLPESNSSSP
jgi:hypothetical protein